MKIETKSAVILLVTLVLGVALGMVGQGLLRREFVQQVTGMRRPPGLVAHMEEVIQPTAQQRDTVHAILMSTAAGNQISIDAVQATLRASLDTMQQRLAPLLSTEQRDRLARQVGRMPDPFRPPPGGDGRRGPPPGGDGRRGPPPGGGPPRDGRPGGPPPPR